MNLTFKLIFTSFAFILYGCMNGQTQKQKTDLSPTEFAEKIETMPQAIILDVRTPGEFNDGHLSNAQNIDWYNKDFMNQVALLDKNNPIFIYCHSGSRSASAASKMRAAGFTEIYELSGGISAWKGKGLSLVK